MNEDFSRKKCSETFKTSAALILVAVILFSGLIFLMVYVAHLMMVREVRFNRNTGAGILFVLLLTLLTGRTIINTALRLNFSRAQFILCVSLLSTGALGLLMLMLMNLKGITLTQNFAIIFFFGEAIALTFLLYVLHEVWQASVFESAVPEHYPSDSLNLAGASVTRPQFGLQSQATPRIAPLNASEVFAPEIKSPITEVEIPKSKHPVIPTNDATLDQLVQLVKQQELQKHEQEQSELHKARLDAIARQTLRNTFIQDYAKYLLVARSAISTDSLKAQAWGHITNKYQVENPGPKPGELFWIAEKAVCATQLVSGDVCHVALSSTVLLELIWVEPGDFTMGSQEGIFRWHERFGLTSAHKDIDPDRSEDEGPETKVTISKGFWLGKVPVTQSQWTALMQENPSTFKEAGDKAPVEGVSWTDAITFCTKLTEQDREIGALPSGYEYSLPTEAQWEFACRANSSSRFHSGNSEQDLDRVGWYVGNQNYSTRPTGLKVPNDLGFHDMHGNVYEWCSDWYYPSYQGGSVVDPRGPPWSTHKIVRGGSWHSEAKFCRSANRGRCVPCGRNHDLGFRIALRAIEK